MSNLEKSDKNNKIEKQVFDIQETAEKADFMMSNINQNTGNETFLRKLFPDAKTRALAQAELAMIKNDSEYKLRALKLLRNTQLEWSQKTIDHSLAKFSLELSKNLKVYSQKIQRDFSASMNEAFDEFLEAIEIRKTKVQQLQLNDPSLAKLVEEQIDKDITIFTSQLGTLKEQFRQEIEYLCENLWK